MPGLPQLPPADRQSNWSVPRAHSHRRRCLCAGAESRSARPQREHHTCRDYVTKLDVKVASVTGVPVFVTHQLVTSDEYRQILSDCLYLGTSHQRTAVEPEQAADSAPAPAAEAEH